jgi:hypothetical protein
MSSSDHHGIPQGNAAIIAAFIGAAAVIIAAIIPVGAALFFGIVQISFPSSHTPSQIANDNSPSQISIEQPRPQATYTVLPTYTPYPTFTPPRTVMAPKSITVIPTASVDRQDPPPGSVIPAGQMYSRNNVRIKLLDTIDANMTTIYPRLAIENRGERDVTVLWSDSLIHVKDDKGNTFRLGWGSIDTQFSLSGGKSSLINAPGCNLCCGQCFSFAGAIDPAAKYLIITVDRLVGMTNMNWRYDLQ